VNRMLAKRRQQRSAGGYEPVRCRMLDQAHSLVSCSLTS
jgi:hypothetical protein